MRSNIYNPSAQIPICKTRVVCSAVYTIIPHTLCGGSSEKWSFPNPQFLVTEQTYVNGVSWIREPIQVKISLARKLISTWDSISGRGEQASVPSRWRVRSPPAAAFSSLLVYAAVWWSPLKSFQLGLGPQIWVGRVVFSYVWDIKAWNKFTSKMVSWVSPACDNFVNWYKM